MWNLRTGVLGRTNNRLNHQKNWATLALLAAAVALPTAARAQLAYTFDSSGTHPAAPVDGSGNWDTTTTNWSNGATDLAWPNDNSIAAFGNGGTAGTVTIQTPVNAGLLVFNPVASGTYTIASGGAGDTLTLTGTPGIDINANANISAPLAGSTGLTIYGTHTLNLSGTNTYTGATTINGGTLQLGAASTLPSATTLTINTGGTFDVNSQTQTIASLTGSGSLLVGSGSNLTLNQTAATTFSGNISGSGTITKLLAGSLTLNTPQPFTGTFALTSTTNNGLILTGNANINNASIVVTNVTAPAPAGGPVIALNNLTPALTAPISFTATTGGDYRMSVNATAGSTNAMSSNINIAFPTTATSGFPSFTMTDTGGSFAISSAITVNSAAADGQIVFRGAGIDNFTGLINAPSKVIIATTDAGTLNFAPQAGSTWGTTGIGGTYTVAISSDAAIAGSASVAGGSNGILFGGGTLQFKNYTSNLSFIQANMSSTTAALGLGAAAGAPSTYTGSINLSGTATNGLNLAGPGTLILNTGALNYGGATNVNSGTIQLGGANIFPNTSALTVAAGAILDLQDNTLTVKSLAGAGNLLLTGPDSFFGIAAGATTTFSGNITGAGSFQELNGALTLSGNNTYAGTTYIGGTVNLASATALPSTNDVSDYGTLNISTFNTTLGSLQGFGSITGSGNLTVGADNNSQVFGGQIKTTGSLTLVGSSTFGMAGVTSTYTGPTNIASGTLQLQASNPLPLTTTLNIASSGTFDLNNNQQQVGAMTGTGTVLLNGQLTIGGAGVDSTFSGSISGGGQLVIAEGTNAFVLAGSSSYTGGTQLVSGALAIASDAPVAGILSGITYNGGNLRFLNYTSNLSFNNVSNLTLGAAIGTASTLAGSITGTTNLNYAGPGTLILSSTSNNYSGGTTITGGNLQFATGAFPTGSSITINAGGALNIAGAFTTITGTLPSINTASTGSVALTGSSSENINFTGYGNLALGAAVNSTYTGTITPGSNTYNLGGGGATLTVPNTNAITGTNNLVIGSTGSAGSVVISGSNNFNGITTLNGGTLAISSDAAINSGTGGITFAGGTLQFNNYTSNLPAFNNDATLNLGAASGAASTLNSAITGSSALTYAGPGTLILASTGNNYSGPTIINAGTLATGAVGALPAATVLTINAAGTLDLNGHSQTVASVSGTGNVVTEPGSALTIGAAGSNTFAGVISGGGGLTKNNSGTLTLTNVNTLTGPINIMQAVTTGGTAIALSGNGSINSASSLNLSYTGTTVTGGTNIPALSLSNVTTPVTVPITITLPTVTGDYRASISNAAGSNTLSGPITLTAGNSTATVNLGSTTGPLTVNSSFTDNDVAGGQLVVRGAATNTTLVGIFNGSIGGPGSAALTVAKTDPSTWLWEPTGSLNWAVTTIGVGILKLGEANALPATSPVMIGGTGTAGATLDVNGFNQSIGGLALVTGTPTTNIILVTNTSTNPATLTINTTGSTSYGQVGATIGGNLTVNITGTGTETFGGADTYTGATNLNGGTLAFTALTNFGAGPINFNGGTLQYATGNIADLSTANLTISSAGATINTNNNGPTFANALPSTGPITKTGAGTLSLAVPQALGAVTVGGGTLRFATSGNTINGTLAINTTGTLETDGNTTATQLRGDGTGTLKIVAGMLKPTAQAQATLSLAAVSIFPTATLDLGNGNLAINYGAGADPLTTTVAYLKNGYNKGNWNGSSLINGSILSSTAAANHATTLGYADNTTLHQVQVKYTWYGDLNLDGVVNNADLTLMADGQPGWAGGDLNFDSVVNADDFALFMYGAASQNGSIGAGVPEPASAMLTIVPLAAGLGLTRKRRHS